MGGLGRLFVGKADRETVKGTVRGSEMARLRASVRVIRDRVAFLDA